MVRLSGLEANLLCRVALRSQTSPSDRKLADRLIHLGLVDETPAGYSLTAEGRARYAQEMQRRGLGSIKQLSTA